MRLRLLHEAIQSVEEQMLKDVRTLVKKKLSEHVAYLEAAHSTHPPQSQHVPSWRG